MAVGAEDQSMKTSISVRTFYNNHGIHQGERNLWQLVEPSIGIIWDTACIELRARMEIDIMYSVGKRNDIRLLKISFPTMLGYPMNTKVSTKICYIIWTYDPTDSDSKYAIS